MRKRKVGDTVWVASCGSKKVQKPCPICFEKKEVTLILGNGDSVILPCEYCGHGFDKPTGTIDEYEYIAEPKQMTVTTVSIKATSEGERIEYQCGHRTLDAIDVFDSEGEARVTADETARQKKQDDETVAERIKEYKRKSFAWNAGYHLREAERDRRSAEWHEENARLCKLRSREAK